MLGVDKQHAKQLEIGMLLLRTIAKESLHARNSRSAAATIKLVLSLDGLGESDWANKVHRTVRRVVVQYDA